MAYHLFIRNNPNSILLHLHVHSTHPYFFLDFLREWLHNVIILCLVIANVASQVPIEWDGILRVNISIRIVLRSREMTNKT